MGKVYTGQTLLTIKLDTGLDCSSATETLIKYKKKDGSTGTWTATVDTDNQTLLYDVGLVTDIDISGVWTLWAKVTFANGKIGYGEPVQHDFYTEGR